MKAIRSFITAVVLLGNLVLLAALSFHVVVAPGKVGIVAKDHLTMIDTYRDVRWWSPADVAAHPALLTRLTDAGRLDLISHVSTVSQPAVQTQTSSTEADATAAPAKPVLHVSTPTTKPAGAAAASHSIFDDAQ